MAVMSEGPWALATPRLRKDWHGLLEHRAGHGRVTADEVLWVVIITMGVAGMRDGVLADHDIERYVLSFFVFWGILISSITYAARFNDHDLWHSAIWGAVTVGLLFQIAFLYHSIRGFAVAACALHITLAVAHARVAFWLQRARVYCGYHAFLNTAIAGLFVFIAAGQHADNIQRRALWLNIFLEPVGATLFKIFVARLDAREAGSGTALDVPGDFAYVLGRHEGLHMTALACSFLFPIALQGQAFLSSTQAATLVVLGNTFALLFKLTVHDCDAVASSGEDSLRHPLRRSRLHSRCFLLLFPLSVLGLALTGVGFVSAILDAAGDSKRADTEAFSRKLLSLGPALSSSVLGFNKLLTRHRHFMVHVAKVACVLSCSLLFLLPLVLGLSRLAAASWCVSVQLLLLLSQVACGLAAREERSTSGWSWHSPRMLKDWAEVDQAIGARVSSNEHFFTVLVAVAVFYMNGNLAKTHDLQQYFLHYMTFYASIALTMRYASRFNAEDGSHKLLWAVYQLAFVMQLEGLTSDNGSAALSQASLFQVSTASIFLWVAVAFWLRVALRLPRARGFATYFAAVSLLSSGMFVATDLLGGATASAGLLWVFAVLSVISDATLVTWMRCCLQGPDSRRSFDVPANIEYEVERFNELYMDVIGVSFIVPNAFYPWAYAHPGLVMAGDACAAILAILLKVCIFDAEPLSIKRHAIRQSQWRAVAFFSLQPVALFGICAFGCSVALLVPEVGAAGMDSWSPFERRLLFGSSCVTWGSLTLVKLLHQPLSPKLHKAKVVLMACGCVVSLVCGCLDLMSDFASLGCVTMLAVLVALGQLIVNALGATRSLERTTTAPLL